MHASPGLAEAPIRRRRPFSPAQVLVLSFAALIASARPGTSILERQLSELSRLTAVIAIVAGTGTLVVLTVLGKTTIIGALIFATGTIVALVPEGLLPTLSVSLAVGAGRMARRNAAIRRLSAVEIVGAATVICTE